MKRRSSCIASVATLLGILITVFGNAAKLLAEPILGDESLGIQQNPASSSEPSDADKAVGLFKKGDYDGSLQAWEEAVKKNPEMPPAKLIMAQLYLQSNKLKEAKAALEVAESDAADDPEVFLTWANVAMMEHDAAKSESQLKKARDLLAGFDKSAKRKAWLEPKILISLADLAESRKDWAGARKLFEECFVKLPKNAALLQRIAFDLLQEKKEDAALTQLRAAVKLNTQSPPAETLMAQLYKRAGDGKNSQKWLAASLAASPKDFRTHMLAGQWAFDEGRLDEARKHAIIAIRIEPKSIEAMLLQGCIATFEKNYPAAELFFDAALRQSPKNAVIRNNLALVLVEQKDEAKSRRALELAEANVNQLPKSPEMASTYGLVLFRLGRLSDAEEALRVAAPIARVDIDTAFVTASVAVDRGHKDEAKELLQAVLKTPRPAMFRQEAEDLLDQLKK